MDSSSWISLARSGLLWLLSATALEAVLLEEVRAECVDVGLIGGHADAAALRSFMVQLQVEKVSRKYANVDAAVLAAASEVGVLIANDLTLGRRARNFGARWLRTADLVVLAVRSGRLSATKGSEAITALLSAGTITTELAEEYHSSL